MAKAETRPLTKILHEIGLQYQKAVTKHKPFNSAHEGWAVIYEEVDELWDEVRAWQPTDHRIAEMRKEAYHVAAMAVRFLTDIIGEGRKP